MQTFAPQQSTPRFVLDTSGSASINVDAVPHLMRCAPLKMLVRTHVVVPEPEGTQRVVQSITICDDQLVELGLQLTEEAFDAAVLPRAMQIDPLVSYSQAPQRKAEDRAAEDCLVVGADGFGLAVSLDRIQQRAQHRDGRLVPKCLQIQTTSSAVIDHA